VTARGALPGDLRADPGPKSRFPPFRRFLDSNKRTHLFEGCPSRLNEIPRSREVFWAFLATFGGVLGLARQGGGTRCRVIFAPIRPQNHDSRRFADFWTLINVRTSLKGVRAV